MWAWLAACDDAEPPARRRRDEPACVAGSWYADADGDGFGDPARATSACAAPAGSVASAADCDDADPRVFPGAVPACDGRPDQDCDGATDPIHADVDGDGVDVCGGDCDDRAPEVLPGAPERCGGVDHDCDRRVDLADADVDPWTCGFCPAAQDFDTVFEASSRRLNPCVLDPTVSYCHLPPEVDTHDNGARTHEIFGRVDPGAPKPRDAILLFLPPGPGNSNRGVNLLATFTGYRVIALGWANDGKVTDHCDDDACFEAFRREVVLGEDASDAIAIAPHDAVVGRFETLLRYLAAEHPEERWEGFLDPAGHPRWDKVVVSGWSDGGSAAVILASELHTAGLVALSPGLDVQGDGFGNASPAEWVLRATPRADRTWGVWSANEGTASPVDYFAATFERWGVPGPVAIVEEQAPPYGGSQAFATRSSFQGEGCTWHATAASDPCMDLPTMLPVYLHLYCALGDAIASAPSGR